MMELPASTLEWLECSICGAEHSPDVLGEVGTAAADDILDAAVAAWSAGRIAVGAAVPLPSPPERDADGHAIAIWY